MQPPASARTRSTAPPAASARGNTAITWWSRSIEASSGCHVPCWGGTSSTPPKTPWWGSSSGPGSRHGRWSSRRETKASRQPHGLTPWSPHHPTDGVHSPAIVYTQKFATEPEGYLMLLHLCTFCGSADPVLGPVLGPKGG